jgi:succinate-semialdehyde dehydrogenase/glutarate-semialdehyde dehydrogenase
LSSKIQSINPATEEVNKEFETYSDEKIVKIAKNVKHAFTGWKGFSVGERASYLKMLAEVLRSRKDDYSRLITIEMGKPIRQAVAEVEKCAWTAEVYAENAVSWLKEEKIRADGKQNLITFQPLGTILSIMPWNFPFWQAIRFAIPALTAGNVSILKHSNVVPMCALALEEVFREAGYPEDVFRTVLTDHKMVEALIKSDYVQGVSITGSVGAGTRIAELAGSNLKKTVLELGGSDPFIVLGDADPSFTCRNAVKGRTVNSGQSCIAAKRFIVVESIVDEFTKKFVEMNRVLKVGDPLDPETEIGPMASRQQIEQLETQVQDAIGKGAEILVGGERVGGKGLFFQPTVLSKVDRSMKVVSEEVFGPVSPIIVVKDAEDAVKVANDTEFGLGASVWGEDEKSAVEVARRLEAGAVFVNGVVKSDPRMPFGGVKKSGIGRELSHYGLKEFVNVKTINIY